MLGLLVRKVYSVKINSFSKGCEHHQHAGFITMFPCAAAAPKQKVLTQNIPKCKLEIKMADTIRHRNSNRWPLNREAIIPTHSQTTHWATTTFKNFTYKLQLCKRDSTERMYFYLKVVPFLTCFTLNST